MRAAVPTAPSRWSPHGRNGGSASNRKPGHFHLGTLDRISIGISGHFELNFAPMYPEKWNSRRR